MAKTEAEKRKRHGVGRWRTNVSGRDEWVGGCPCGSGNWGHVLRDARSAAVDAVCCECEASMRQIYRRRLGGTA